MLLCACASVDLFLQMILNHQLKSVQFSVIDYIYIYIYMKRCQNAKWSFSAFSLCFGIFNLFGVCSTLPDKGAHECAHKLPKGIWLPFDFADSHPVSWFLSS